MSVVEQAPGLRFGLGRTKDPIWQNIEKQLLSAKRRNGCVGLCILEVGEFGHDEVQLRADRMNFLLTYFKAGLEEDEVYSLFSTEAHEGHMDILGDYWGSGMVGRDFSVVLKAFKEFYETGRIDLASYDIC